MIRSAPINAMQFSLRTLLVLMFVLVLTFVLGLWLGGTIQHWKTGYVYKLRNEKTYSSPNGTIRLEYATESVGMAFLDPGTSTIALEEPDGTKFILYKAPRAPRESFPFVKDVEVTPEEMRWDDGCFAYTLHIEASQRGDRESSHP